MWSIIRLSSTSALSIGSTCLRKSDVSKAASVEYPRRLLEGGRKLRIGLKRTFREVIGLPRTTESALNTSTSEAEVSTLSQRGIIDRTLNSSESIWTIKFERSRRRVPRPLRDLRIRESGMECSAMTISSAKPLAST